MFNSTHPARDLRDFTTDSLPDMGVDAADTATTSLLHKLDDKFNGVVTVDTVETGSGGENNPSDGVGNNLLLSVVTNLTSNRGFWSAVVVTGNKRVLYTALIPFFKQTGLCNQCRPKSG